MRTMQSLAPAKINVYLRIVGRRPDGYHLLDSLMVPISLYDEIHLAVALGEQRATRPGAALVVSCDDPTVPGDETNLAYKAAALVCQEAGLQARICIHLRKRIPAGAGLGGGSSNAATVLKSLNTLLALGWTEAHLCQLGARLGADVPFFIPCRPARIGGIGDIVTTVPPLPARSVVLVVPPFSVSTPWAYRRFDALPPVAPASVPPWQFAPAQWPSHAWLSTIWNALSSQPIRRLPRSSSAAPWRGRSTHVWQRLLSVRDISSPYSRRASGHCPARAWPSFPGRAPARSSGAA